MLASLLPGLRTVRAPLAAGYVAVFASWLAVANRLPTKASATGVVADLYGLAEKVGTGPTLAAVTFTAYVAGVILIEVAQFASSLLFDLANVVYRLVPKWLRPAANQAAERLALISPGGASRRSRLEALDTVVLRQLSLRFDTDEVFRAELTDHLRALQQQAEQHHAQLPSVLAGAPAAELIADAAERTYHRIRLLRRLVDYRWHAEELLWESRLTGGSAASVSSVSEERDRGNAEAEFRIGLVLPVMWLVVVLAYRVDPWWLAGAVVPAGLLYLGSVAKAKADGAVLRAVAEGVISWPAVERLATAQIRLRPPDEFLPTTASPPATADTTSTAEDPATAT
ncbi:hypothetical protein [Dactylosporangium sp. CA-233914]|uniref:hypothetical protein n=1 Tax=Dactylosporangium sp. CA-233914 TaxID=3239934 RepID=UPI003D8E7F7F